MARKAHTFGGNFWSLFSRVMIMMMMNVMLKMLLINISASILEEYQNLSVTLSVTRQSYPSLANSARMWISLIILTQFDHQNDYDQSSNSVECGYVTGLQSFDEWCQWGGAAEDSLERGEGGNGRETQGVRKDKNWHMIVSFVFMYLEGPLCSDIKQICICDLIYLIKVILAIMRCYIDWWAIYIFKIPSVFIFTIIRWTLRLQNKHHFTWPEIKYNREIALPTNPSSFLS